MMENGSALETRFGETEIIRFLRDAVPDFEVCTRRAIECILAIPTFMPKGFAVSRHTDSPTTFKCAVQAGNSRYSAALYLGFNQADLKELSPEESDIGIIMDIMGEIANVIAGSFLGRKSFQAPFGDMHLSPPRFFQERKAEPESWSIHGILKANGVRIFLDFMIKPGQKDDLT